MEDDWRSVVGDEVPRSGAWRVEAQLADHLEAGSVFSAGVGDSDDEAAAEQMQISALEQEALAELREITGRLSRISAARLAVRFAKGRVAWGNDRRRPTVRQKAFGVEKSEMLVNIADAQPIIDRLRVGGVYTQIVARTGFGKSRVFPAKVAAAGLRVLLLEADMCVLKDVSAAQRDKTKVRRNVSFDTGERLVVMTYDDFVGQFRTDGGEEILKYVDVVIADESHAPRAVVASVKAFMATLAPERCSLLLLTATGGGENDAQSLNSATPIVVNDTVIAAVERGRFDDGPRCRDRTLFIVPSDGIAARVQERLHEVGHNCYLLDSASRPSEVAKVKKALEGDAIVRRFLVVTERYGMSYNFPISDVYTDGASKEYIMSGDRTVDAVMVPVTESMLRQHAGRTNRGLAPTGTVYFMQGYGKPGPDVELMQSERFTHYLQLRAAAIEPLRSVQPEPGFVPFGITTEVAADLLAINLPPEVSIRFFASDGRLPAEWAQAMSRFAEHGRRFRSSKHSKPLGYNDWITVPLGGYYDLKECGKGVKVPFVPTDSDLRATIVGLSAIAHGLIDIPRERLFPVDSEPEDSDAAVGGTRRGPTMIPRLVVNEERPVVPDKVVPWGYSVPMDQQYGSRRSGMVGADVIDSGVLGQLRNLDLLDVVDQPPPAAVRDAGQLAGKERVEVIQTAPGTPIEATSPGGSVVAIIRKSSWLKLVRGTPLDSKEAISFVSAFHRDPVAFSASLIFSNWSNVWLGVIRTFSSRTVMQAMLDANLFPFVSALMHALYARYQIGVRNVVNTSIARGNFWKRILRGFSFVDAFRRSEEKGEAEVVQSQALFQRIMDIRAELAETLDHWSELGLFAPTTVTSIQRNLGISGPTGVSYVDEPNRQFQRRFRVLGNGYMEAADGSGEVRPVYGVHKETESRRNQ